MGSEPTPIRSACWPLNSSTLSLLLKALTQSRTLRSVGATLNCVEPPDPCTELNDVLTRVYPEQWVAVAVCETDPATGISRGELLAHDWHGGYVTAFIAEYHVRYPNRVIKYFRTGRPPRRTGAQTRYG